ncbi:outer membrane receptor protein involved in Fe transport [Flavobacterium sp. CG_23.5]|uniref:TonB-dependent receptor domain-containing protein n=1 Tax=Flavobacterium sp. CG_23.5 TaxID=2760708 RepID=UPI001AE10FA4|nr:TonB-dependent receptor [Flavobacterium sp. CG_23.5]MBP2282958.1 outer membrane receptor protein involved in Fe transport [Flavobacterium sp. CG_23.5]
MNLKLILACIFGTVISMQAQNSVKPTLLENSGSISGKVIDKKSNEPLAYVNIVVKEENKVLTGGITSDKGMFLIKNLPLKNYTLEIQFIGYKTVTKSISLSPEVKNVNLNTISLEEDAIELKGVEIVNEKSTIEQKIDRKIINVGKDLISAGATAAEIMNNIPSVSIDPQTNAISLRGNSNVRILIDGKPTTIEASQILQQIPSSSIKQIELITNPSAKYNPEGMSGIINIVLNKNSKIGFNGSVNNGVTFGKTPKLNSSFDMNYRTGKFNLYGNYGLNTGKQSNRGFLKTTEPGQEDFQKFSFINNNTSHLAKVGFDFYLNEKNTISFYTNQNMYNGTGNSVVSVDFVNPAKSDITQLFDNKNNNYTQTYNLDYKKTFKKEGHNLELEVNYSKDNNKENAVFNTPATNYITNKGNNSLINLDYTNPLSETAKLELGLESRIENTRNNFLKDNSYNSEFAYDRNIYSAYATVSKQWGKWSAQAGTRFEKYNAKALFKKVNENDATFNDDLFTLYPSGFINYNQSDKNTFNFSVSRRVDRPSIDQVNPIREWSTPQIDSEGNPNLFPQFTNSYELNYTRKTKIGSITSGVFYRRINDEITRTLFENPNNSSKLILSYANLNDNNAYGFEISGNLDFKKWWSANISFDAYNKKTKGIVANEFVEVDVTTFNTRISNTFKPSKNLRLQLSGMYRGRDLGLQFERKPMWKIDMGSSYTVLKGSGTITARFSDVFNTMNFAFEGSKPKRQQGQFNWESQTAYVGFNYRFGSGKNKAIQRKQRDKNETQGSGGLL